MQRSDDVEDLRLAVAMLRAFRGWSQAELADATGLGASAVSRYESGAQTPTPQTLNRIAAAVGLPSLLATGLLSWIRAARSARAGNAFQTYAGDVIDCAAAELGNALAALMRAALEEIQAEELYDDWPS
ncbi:MAG TPA: helix-turn-helix transcriptional regulator [Thermoanaerobaculia bacterium]|nr:helix-turn-helix transcriptional regulator [Thermoanaerobaculia bacterium]